MGNSHQRSKYLEAKSAFIKEECVSFPKLCSDIIQVLNLFSNDKYVQMIGFDFNIRIYFTPR